MLKKLMEVEETQLRRRVEEIDAKKVSERISVIRKEKEGLVQALDREKARQDETKGVPLAEATGVVPGETVVYDKLMKIKGTLVALKGKNAEIMVSGKSVSVMVERLIVLAEKRTKRVSSGTVATDAGAYERCDVRGVNAEEACGLVEKALDTAYTAKSLSLIIVHGHGTGVLKKAVRGYLATLADRYHFKSRRAPDEQGGDGATLVEFQ
jgi:DNA mismatch repair protein MutS2